MGDGHLGKCKECTKLDVRERYFGKGRQRVTEYEVRRGKDPERKKKILEYRKKSRKTNPMKWSARQRVARAIKKGVLTRLPCRQCGEIKSQAHHEDYSKPLEVVWLCRTHHRLIEGKLPYDMPLPVINNL